MRWKSVRTTFNYLFMSVVLFMSFFLYGQPVQAASTQGTTFLQVANEKLIGTEVRVPITVRYVTNRTQNQLQVASGKFTIKLPQNSLLTYQGFTPSPAFNGELFQTYFSETNGKLTVEFTSVANGNNQSISNEVVGYLNYQFSSNAKNGDSALITITNVSLQDQRGSQIDVTSLDGSIEHQLMIGDVVGKDAVTPAAAVRILQHVNRTKPITSLEELQSADVNSDGIVDLADATKILRYLANLDQSFLTVKSVELPFAAVNEEYNSKLEAVYGEAPYEWKVTRGRLPYGLELNEKTGEITGTVTREFDQTIQIEVKDVTGQSVTKEIPFLAVKTDIKEIEQLPTVTVAIGEDVRLPKQVVATFTNGTTKNLTVRWPAVNTKKVGVQQIKGKIEGTILNASVRVIVTEDRQILDQQPATADQNMSSTESDINSQDLIKNIEVKKFTLLNTAMHTIIFDASPNVFSAKLSFGSDRNETKLDMLYDPGDEEFKQPRFSRGTTKLQSNQNVTIAVYDQYGQEIGKQTFILNDYLK